MSVGVVEIGLEGHIQTHHADPQFRAGLHEVLLVGVLGCAGLGDLEIDLEARLAIGALLRNLEVEGPEPALGMSGELRGDEVLVARLQASLDSHGDTGTVLHAADLDEGIDVYVVLARLRVDVQVELRPPRAVEVGKFHRVEVDGVREIKDCLDLQAIAKPDLETQLHRAADDLSVEDERVALADLVRIATGIRQGATDRSEYQLEELRGDDAEVGQVQCLLALGDLLLADLDHQARSSGVEGHRELDRCPWLDPNRAAPGGRQRDVGVQRRLGRRDRECEAEGHRESADDQTLLSERILDRAL